MKSLVKRIVTACTFVACGVSLIGILSCVSKKGDISEGVFKTKAKYSLKSVDEGDGDLTKISYLKSVEKDYMLLATGFDDTTLNEVNTLSQQLKQQASLGYVINGVNYESHKYYQGITTLNAGSEQKTWTAEDIFGETDKVHMIVDEIEMGKTTIFSVEAYIKVGEQIVVQQTREIKLTPTVYLDFVANLPFTAEVGQETPTWLYGSSCFAGHNDSRVKVDDLLKFTYLIDFTAIKDESTLVNLACQTYYKCDGTNWTPKFEQYDISFAESGIKLGKVALSYIIKVPATFTIDSWLMPYLRFSSGVCGTWVKTLVTDPYSEIDNLCEGYYQTKTHEYKGDFFGAYEKKLGQTVDFAWSFAAADDAWSAVSEGTNFGASYFTDMKAGDTVSLTALLDITSVGNKPIIRSIAWDQVSLVSDEYVDVKGKIGVGKMAYTYTFKLPSNFTSANYLHPQILFSGLSGTETKWILTSGSANLSDYIPQDYTVLDKHYITTGSFAYGPKTVYLDFVANLPFTAEVGQETPTWLYGSSCFAGHNDSRVKVDDLLKITYLIDFTDIKDESTLVNLACQTYYKCDGANWTPKFEQYDISFAESGIKLGKVALSYIIKVPATFTTDSWLMPYLRFSSGVCGTWDKTLVTGVNCDMDELCEGYYQTKTHEYKGDFFGTYEKKLGQTVDFSWGFDAADDAWSAVSEGTNFGVSYFTDMKAGDTVSLTALLDITSVGNKPIIRSIAWDQVSLVSDEYVDVKGKVGVGKMAYTYTFKLPSNFTSANYLHPQILFSGLSGTETKWILTSGSANLSDYIPQDYTILSKHYITTGSFAY